ncbi:MAG: hypothetical protein WDZ46_10085 [Solirubrobacterales bacterium]
MASSDLALKGVGFSSIWLCGSGLRSLDALVQSLQGSFSTVASVGRAKVNIRQTDLLDNVGDLVRENLMIIELLSHKTSMQFRVCAGDCADVNGFFEHGSATL